MTTIINADCLQAMREMPDNSVDAIISDPPYGLSNTTPDKVTETIIRWASGDREYVPQGKGFMGAAWDGFVPPPAVWDECFRVLKPGGHMAVFAGTRTMDLMTLGIRLSGMEIRDSIAWMYGSGMPKSLNVSKAIDKTAPRAGMFKDFATHFATKWQESGMTRADFVPHFPHYKNGESVKAQLSNWKLAKNVPSRQDFGILRDLIGLSGDWSTLIERVEAERKVVGQIQKAELKDHVYFGDVESAKRNGRAIGYGEYDVTISSTDAAKKWEGWGSNLKPSFEPIILARKPLQGTIAANVVEWGTGAINVDATRIQAKALDGLDARFKYCAKAPKKERPRYEDADGQTIQHPTTKPLSLMKWICRLLVPPGGTVLDPFAGSGTTVEAAILEGFNPVGIEAHAPYIPLIEQRVARAEQGQAALNIA